jgi:hypothetical protein
VLFERVAAYNAALPTPAPTNDAQPFVQGTGLDKLPPTRTRQESGVLQVRKASFRPRSWPSFSLL